MKFNPQETRNALISSGNVRSGSPLELSSRPSSWGKLSPEDSRKLALEARRKDCKVVPAQKKGE
jgi:hypothetical protein